MRSRSGDLQGRTHAQRRRRSKVAACVCVRAFYECVRVRFAFGVLDSGRGGVRRSRASCEQNGTSTRLPVPVVLQYRTQREPLSYSNILVLTDSHFTEDDDYVFSRTQQPAICACRDTAATQHRSPGVTDAPPPLPQKDLLRPPFSCWHSKLLPNVHSTSTP